MPYMIDGHNLIGALPNISLADPDDEVSLMRLLSRYMQGVRKKAVVYFDQRSPGANQPDAIPNLSVVFIRPPRTADQAIRAHLRSLGREAVNWSVVSSDREVQRAASQAGARVVSSQEFSHFLGQASPSAEQVEKHPETLTEDELKQWIDLFRNRSK